MWEGSGWISDIDPYGWFQWYCRFYMGRRSTDDDRQIARGMGVMGPKVCVFSSGFVPRLFVGWCT